MKTLWLFFLDWIPSWGKAYVGQLCIGLAFFAAALATIPIPGLFSNIIMFIFAGLSAFFMLKALWIAGRGGLKDFKDAWTFELRDDI